MERELFEQLKAQFYDLTPPIFGNYKVGGSAKNRRTIDLTNARIDLSSIHIDKWEAQFEDVEHSIWLDKHPDYKPSGKLEATNQPERVEIAMWIVKNGTREQQQWALFRLWAEFLGMIKQAIRSRSVPQNIYADVLEQSYQHFFEQLLKPDFVYDKTKSRPSTFFYMPIQSVVIKAYGEIKNGTTSTYYSEKKQRVKNAINKYFAEYETEPSIPVLQTLTGMKLQDLEDVLFIMASENCISLDEADELQSNLPGPEEQVIEMEKREMLYAAINTLTPEEQKVTMVYWKLEPNPLKGNPTYANTAKRVGISEQKAKQLVNSAIRKLRSNKALRSYHETPQKEVERITRDEDILGFIKEIDNTNVIIEGRKKKPDEDVG